MSIPKYQGQHRISQVYLKGFGYLKEGKWYIAVWEKTKNYTDYVLIENFTKETNVFDLPFFETVEERRHFETKSVIIEDQYKKILTTIDKQQQLTPRHEDILRHYTANLICRARPYRELFEDYLKYPHVKEAFLREITMFKQEELPILKESLSYIPEETHLNYITGHIMNFLVTVFRSFNCIILKDYENRGWFTSDNPVIIDTQQDPNEISDDYQWTIPIESEIYFPLSPDYCLFLFHPKSLKNSNPLRNLKKNKVHQSDEKTHEKICHLIGAHKSHYFLFNQEMEPFFLDQ